MGARHPPLQPNSRWSVLGGLGLPGQVVGSSPVCGAKQIWKTKSRRHRHGYVSLFGLSCMRDAGLRSGARRFRHGLQTSDTCIICDQSSETMTTLCSAVSFPERCGASFFARCTLQSVSSLSSRSGSFHARKMVPKSVSGGDSLFFLMAWNLWNERDVLSGYCKNGSAPCRSHSGRVRLVFSWLQGLAAAVAAGSSAV